MHRILFVRMRSRLFLPAVCLGLSLVHPAAGNDMATGGDVTTNGGYRIHTFTNSGLFEALVDLEVDVLVVGGGGGGIGRAGSSNRAGGGVNGEIVSILVERGSSGRMVGLATLGLTRTPVVAEAAGGSRSGSERRNPCGRSIWAATPAG